MNVSQQFPWTTAEDSILEKDWACGSRKQADTVEFIIRRINGVHTAEYTTVRYSPAWWKIIDEIVVNACDHFIRMLGSATPVTTIRIEFVPETGHVRVYNDGPGVPVVIHPDSLAREGKELYLPTCVFGRVFQGSNRVQAPDCIVGGVNGMGAKIMQLLSTTSAVETVDNANYFVQQWHNHKSVEDDPVVVPLNTQSRKKLGEKAKQHTMLSFMPDYEGLFGYHGGYDATKHADLVDVIRTRAWFAAAYVGYTLATMPKGARKSACTVTFNGDIIPCKNITDIAKLCFPDAPSFTTTITPKVPANGERVHFKYPWEVCVVVTNTIHEARSITNVNGIVVADGKHVAKIADILVDEIGTRMAKALASHNIKFIPSMVRSNTFIFINSKVPKPDWSGQRKDVLATDKRLFAGYELESALLGKIATCVEAQVLAHLRNRPIAKTRAAGPAGETDRYKPALKCDKTPLACRLLLVEGKSAKTQVTTGITSTIGIDLHGVMSTGGVIPNALRECVVSYDNTTGKKTVKMSKMFAGNIFIKEFLAVTGLNPLLDYDIASPTYKREMATLYYGNVTACVDQDLDGKGCILGLIITMFMTLWPKLVNQGYLEWFSTPIIRAMPKSGGKILAFYSVPEYDEWAEKANTELYRINYYKGFGTHSAAQTKHMFTTFHAHLHKYYADERSAETVKIYFGDDPALRKQVLSMPPMKPSRELVVQQYKTMRISISDHVLYETDEYQRDNLDRKLDHVIDGQNQAGRKILDGLLKYCSHVALTRVEKVSGPISEHENYHHGGASLMDSIQKRAFVAVGGLQLPILKPESNLGSRMCGGEDAAAPRYTDVLLNKRLTDALFPAADYHILEFELEEGQRGEPKYFVPVLPVVICESGKLPAHGWAMKLWARDVFAVIANVRVLIELGDDMTMLSMPSATRSGKYTWKGEFRNIRGAPYSVGKYTIVGDQVRITELPLRTWTNKYIENIKKKQIAHPELITSVSSGKSDDERVDITIELKPGALDYILTLGDSCFTDGIEEFFLLRDHMNSHINLMGPDNTVLEFKSYGEIIPVWFATRKRFYAERIDRILTLLRLRVIMQQNIIRYAEIVQSLDLPGKSEDDMDIILANANFDKIAAKTLTTPLFTPTKDLNNVILRGPKAKYKYLLGISDIKKSAERISKYKKKLVDLEQEIIDTEATAARGRFRGAALFAQEVDNIEKIIKEGLATEWKFGEYGKCQL